MVLLLLLKCLLLWSEALGIIVYYLKRVRHLLRHLVLRHVHQFIQSQLLAWSLRLIELSLLGCLAQLNWKSLPLDRWRVASKPVFSPIWRHHYVTSEWVVVADETFLLPDLVVKCLTVLLLEVLLYLLACQLIEVYRVLSQCRCTYLPYFVFLFYLDVISSSVCNSSAGPLFWRETKTSEDCPLCRRLLHQPSLWRLRTWLFHSYWSHVYRSATRAWRPSWYAWFAQLHQGLWSMPSGWASYGLWDHSVLRVVLVAFHNHRLKYENLPFAMNWPQDVWMTPNLVSQFLYPW